MKPRFYNVVMIIGSLFFIYFLITQINSKPIASTKTLLEAPLGPEIPKEVQKNIENKSNFLERKVAGIMASFAETPQGKEFLHQIIRPAMVIDSSDSTVVVDLPREFSQYEILEHGKEKKPECGDLIKVYNVDNKKHYEYLLGENKVGMGLDAIISTMSLGETRRISPIKGDQITLKLEKIEASPKKALIRFSQKPVIAKLACGTKVLINFNIKSSGDKYIFRMDEYLSKNHTRESVDAKAFYIELSPKYFSSSFLKAIIDGGLKNVSYAIIKRHDLLKVLKVSPFSLIKNLPNDDFYALEYSILGYEEVSIQ